MVNYYGSQPKLVSSLGKRATTLTVMFVDVCGNHMYIIIYVIIGSLSLITGPVVQSLFDWEDGWGISLRIRLAVEVFGATPLQYPLGNLAKSPASDDEKKQLGIHELAPIDSCCSRSSKGIHVFQTLEFARRGTWIHIKLHIDVYIYIYHKWCENNQRPKFQMMISKKNMQNLCRVNPYGSSFVGLGSESGSFGTSWRGRPPRRKGIVSWWRTMPIWTTRPEAFSGHLGRNRCHMFVDLKLGGDPKVLASVMQYTVYRILQ